MKAQALWITAPEVMEIREEELPAPKYDELQIQTKAVGICAWDSYLYRGMSAPGPLPYRLGHEGVGVVTAMGEGVKGFQIGDKIFVGTGGDEMMASAFNVQYDCVAKIPEGETDYAKWVGEPAVCIVNVLQKADIQPGDSVVLIGCGYMGLLTVQGLRATTLGELTILDINQRNLDIANEYFPGCCFRTDTPEGQARIEKIKAQGGANVVIEMAAAEATFQLANELTAGVQGKLVFGAWHRGQRTIDGNRWHTTGLTVLNVAPKTNARFRDLTVPTGKLIQRGIYDTARLVTHTAPFGDLEAMHQVFRHSIHKTDGYLKGVFLFD